ncbi:Hypothetical protein NCS54_00077700 [Fusarium falciforme]|uniref:Hypothetical protein n=1 Tax=Fusarium falciforme TaxID=195108 RepID=UPI0023005721|nr:Hypothetical protein NCS54_00077700 [Fusarium falciforme]WAO83581.1 Hypothetical protein NCS54_00077700 [Fusarium falciforme]
MSKGPVVIGSTQQFDALLKSSRIVVADFYADWCGPCKQIAPLYASLSNELSRENILTFVKINSEEQGELSERYQVSALPTFLLFLDGKQIDKVQGANPPKLQAMVQKLAAEVDSLGESGAASSSGGNWKGAEIPRGYSDITDQIEVRDLEVLNADEESGSVRVLFEGSKPSGLSNGKGTAKDFVQSGADDQLLLFIPFQSTVKLHTLQASCAVFFYWTTTLTNAQLTSLPPKDDEDAPMRPGIIHLYINRPHNLDFSEADETEPTQIIDIPAEDWNADGTVNVGLRFVKFTKTSTLIVYVQQGEGDGETVRLDRVKLIGEAGAKREMGKLQKVGEDE